MAGVKKPKQKSQLKGGEQLAMRISLDPTRDTPAFYVNNVEVGRTQHDFLLLGARIPAKISPDELEGQLAGEVLRVEPDVQLILPPTLIPGLIAALQKQLAINLPIQETDP